MKFTTSAAVLLATGITTITAMPWSSKAKNPSSVFEEDITLRIEVVPKMNQQHQNQNPLFSAAAAKKSPKQDLASFLEHNYGDGGDAKAEICWMLCASEEIRCPEGWHSKQLGDCWTCCKTAENDSVDL
ncbi:hypothetical protein QBC32DRAFT_379135 [Pseudoneurospora amorphoporcata]|uniref:Uncharacterized protein n=1 Tax=Pseudoneurospora amorphoporcata TaxID=241081 RepID=A0AAN6NQG7_9PEZI|nr:hypothetical protein QBC32DRAFT_379135 [Pseudoneurospora amorphoporcata]